MKHLGDIRAISGYTIPPVDVVTGGSPCQDLSIAGKRAGLAGERSSLFLEQIRVVKELRNADGERGRTGELIRPRFMLWENVTGAFSSNQRQDFRAVLEACVRIALPDAPDIPLPAKWPLADAWYGVGWSLAYRVFDAQFWGVPQRRRRIALVCDFGGCAAPEVLFVRKGVFGDTAPCFAAREGAAGNSAPCAYPPVARSLTARNDGSPCIDRGPDVIVQAAGFKGGSSKSDIGWQEEIAPTLSAEMSGVEPTILTMSSGQTNAEVCDDLSPTLNCNHEQPIVAFGLDCEYNAYPERYGTLRAHTSGGAEESVMNAGIVRRLTPLECERLQGFPDGWTAIGEWTDSHGKRRQTSDAARYKALGNSIALPPWKWVLKRIAAQYERDATLGSLFDGIGGFPLIWEQLNGKGSALWASEIEEFPMAVTRRHFGES